MCFGEPKLSFPTKLRPQILQELHDSHPGIVRMKGLARSRVWWPSITRDIETCVQSCVACQGQRNQPPPVPLHPWPLSREPWERIHIDFAGPVDGIYYLVLVDSYSKWIEVEPMRTTTAEKTVSVLQTIFARFGLPKELVSDNGPQFTSATFTEFMNRNGIHHSRSAPYHPATNGAAERVVQTLKRSLRTGETDSGSLTHKLARFLLNYRNTPTRLLAKHQLNCFSVDRSAHVSMFCVLQWTAELLLSSSSRRQHMTGEPELAHLQWVRQSS